MLRHSNGAHPPEQRYQNNASRRLLEAIDVTSELIVVVEEILEEIFRSNTPYQKAGLCLRHLISATEIQRNLFCGHANPNREKRQRLTAVCDHLN